MIEYLTSVTKNNVTAAQPLQRRSVSLLPFQLASRHLPGQTARRSWLASHLATAQLPSSPGFRGAYKQAVFLHGWDTGQNNIDNPKFRGV